MPLMDRPISQVTADDIRALVEDAVSEGRDIEFKQVLPGTSDSDRKEFLADVSSFANAAGGVVIYGLREEEGVPVEIVGIGRVDVDLEILRLENLLRDALDPRLPGVSLGTVEVDEVAVLLIRVPMSWAGPHMVTFRGTSRFFGRNSRGKFQLDVRELAAAFSRMTTVEERLGQFRTDRIGKILAGETPARLYEGAPTILHMVPYSALHDPNQLDIASLDTALPGLHPLRSQRRDLRYNFEGLAVFPVTSDGIAHAYLQLFRSGALEAVNVTMNLPESEQGDPFIRSTVLEPVLIQHVEEYLQLLESLGVEPPIAIAVSLSGDRGYRVLPETQNRSWSSFRHPIDRDLLPLPVMVTDRFDADVPALLRPVFDTLWNAAGWEGSFNYDADGIYQGRRLGPGDS